MYIIYDVCILYNIHDTAYAYDIQQHALYKYSIYIILLAIQLHQYIHITRYLINMMNSICLILKTLTIIYVLKMIIQYKISLYNLLSTYTRCMMSLAFMYTRYMIRTITTHQ